MDISSALQGVQNTRYLVADYLQCSLHICSSSFPIFYRLLFPLENMRIYKLMVDQQQIFYTWVFCSDTTYYGSEITQYNSLCRDGIVNHIFASHFEFNFFYIFGLASNCISYCQQVYLFVSSGRVTGCLVAEPIEKAYRIVSSSTGKKSQDQNGKGGRENSVVLQFGEVSFQREIVRKNNSAKGKEMCDSVTGEILCEKEAVPASCGIRAIWVTPSNRRKHIASHLLDAVR